MNQDSRVDVTGLASNFYDGVTQKEVEDFHKNIRINSVRNGEDTLIAFGLNSKTC